MLEYYRSSRLGWSVDIFTAILVFKDSTRKGEKLESDLVLDTNTMLNWQLSAPR